MTATPAAPAAPAVAPGPGLLLPDPPDAVRVLTLYLVLLFAIPAPMVVTAMGQVGGPATLLALGCFLWWCWHHLNRTVALAPGQGLVRNAALVLLMVLLLTYAHAAALPLPGDERSPADGTLLRLLGMVGLLCVVADGIVSLDRLWTFVDRLSLALGAVAGFAVVQMVTGQVWVDRITIPGLSPAEGLSLIDRGMITRPSSTATHPIEFAAVLAMGMPLAFASAAHATRRRGLHRAAATLVPVVVLLTGSRTAIVCGAIAFLVMMAAWTPAVRLLATGVAGLLLAVTFVAVPGFLGTLRGLFAGASGDPSVKSRTNSVAVVQAFWENHLWLGRGMGTFLPKYWILDNMYFQIAIGMGVVGLVTILGLVGTALFAVVRAAGLFAEPLDRQLAIATIAATLAGTVSLALFDTFSFPQAAGTYFIVLGICGALYRFAIAEVAP